MSIKLKKANEVMNMDISDKKKCQHSKILQRRRSCDSFDSPPLTRDSLTTTSPARRKMGEGAAREIGRREVLSSQQQKPSQVYCLKHCLGRKYSAGTNEKPNLSSLNSTPLCNTVDDGTGHSGQNKSAVLNQLKAKTTTEQLFESSNKNAKKELTNTPRKKHSLGSNEKPNLALLNSAMSNACVDNDNVRHVGSTNGAESNEKPTPDLLFQETKSNISNKVTSSPRRRYSVGSVQKPKLDLLNYALTPNTDDEFAFQRRRKSSWESNEMPTGPFEVTKSSASKENINRPRRKHSAGSNEKPNSENLQSIAKINMEGRFGRRLSVGLKMRPSFSKADEMAKANIKSESMSKSEIKCSADLNEKPKSYPYEAWKPNTVSEKFRAIPVLNLENNPGRKYSGGKNEKPDLTQLHKVAQLSRDGSYLPATSKPEPVHFLAVATSCCDSASLACSSVNFGTSENFLPELELQPRQEDAAEKLRNIESWLNGL